MYFYVPTANLEGANFSITFLFWSKAKIAVSMHGTV